MHLTMVECSLLAVARDLVTEDLTVAIMETNPQEWDCHPRVSSQYPLSCLMAQGDEMLPFCNLEDGEPAPAGI